MNRYSFSIRSKPDVCEVYERRDCKRLANLITDIYKQYYFINYEVQLTLMSGIVCKKHYYLTKKEIDFKEPKSEQLEYMIYNPLIKRSEVKDFEVKILMIDMPKSWTEERDGYVESKLLYDTIFKLSSVESIANRISHHYLKGDIITEDVSKAILIYAHPIDYKKYITIKKSKIKSLTSEEALDVDVEELI